jgi:hypothetical protein
MAILARLPGMLMSDRHFDHSRHFSGVFGDGNFTNSSFPDLDDLIPG